MPSIAAHLWQTKQPRGLNNGLADLSVEVSEGESQVLAHRHRPAGNKQR